MLSKKDLSWLSVARAFARESELRKKHGAVVVRSGSVVGVGCNKHRNDPAYLPKDVVREHTSYHAEEIAIRQAGDNTKGATIYVARVNNQGEDRNSQPCLPCGLLIREAQIKKIVYTTEGRVEYAVTDIVDGQVMVCGGQYQYLVRCIVRSQPPPPPPTHTDF